MTALALYQRTPVNNTTSEKGSPSSRSYRIWRSLLLSFALSMLWQGVQKSPVFAAPPHWFPYVNTYRAFANLPSLTQNAEWSGGCVNHSRYMVKNNVIGHSENPALPFYTASGDIAAMNSNVMVSSSVNAQDVEAIDSWMEGPFHALGILDPALSQTGFGSYREADGGYQMGGCLDVLRGLGPIPVGTTFPIRWPRPGGIMPLLSYNGNESPDPLTSCPGYTAPTGAPIIIQLGPGNVVPQVTAHSLRRGVNALDHCIYDETNYTNPNGSDQSLVRSILNSKDAVVIIPRTPLVSGSTYTVSITTNGQVHTHSFLAKQGGLPIDFIGVFRISTRLIQIDRNRNGVWSGCTIDDCLGPFGASSDLPVAGDWSGDGGAKIGVFRPGIRRWYLDRNGNGLWDGCSLDACAGPFGSPTDLPVVGDWNGNGTTMIGVFRPSERRWYLDRNGNGLWDGCNVDTCAGPFGSPTDLPVVGDWSANGTPKIGVFRPSNQQWYLDRNGNGLWDNCNLDICAGPFGDSTDQPLIGAW